MPDFKTPLTSIEAAKAWIKSLCDAEMMFHFEDSPESILKGGTDEPLFTKDEAINVRVRVNELYALDWTVAGHECPIGYALEVMEPDQYGATLDRLTEEYSAFLSVHHLPEVSAEELIFETLTDHQRQWVSTFIRRWEAVAQAEVA